MKRRTASFAAVVLGLGAVLFQVLSASAQQRKQADQTTQFDLSGCWTLTSSSYYNNTDRVTVPPYDYMQQLLVDPTPNHSATPSQMLPKGPPLPQSVIKFQRVSGGAYAGKYIDGVSQFNKDNDLWLANVVAGGTSQQPTQPIYFVPMSMTGPSGRNFSPMADAYIATLAGIADNDMRITGTWVDSRGAMSIADLICTDQIAHEIEDPNPPHAIIANPQCTDASKVPVDANLHTNIFPVGTGRYTLDRIPGKLAWSAYPEDVRNSCSRN